NGTTETYTYDSFGNLTGKTTGSAAGQVLVDSSSNRLRGETYDAAGNATTHKGADRFSFDSLNMMDEVEVAFGSTRRMLYGPDEERIGIVHDENLIHSTDVESLYIRYRYPRQCDRPQRGVGHDHHRSGERGAAGCRACRRCGRVVQCHGRA
ncbi:MAG TPA: hypothetical protein VEO54_19600, partial [Thermoanaerobaculia bacterium]|nr:hypothetical protein [Thermoanaerobaculia bacterium]